MVVVKVVTRRGVGDGGQQLAQERQRRVAERCVRTGGVRRRAPQHGARPARAAPRAAAPGAPRLDLLPPHKLLITY